MKVEQVTISERPLIDAYRNNFAQVAEFFLYDPNNKESFTQRNHYLQNKSFPREQVAQALEVYNRRIGATAKTLVNIERLREAQTVAVVTGQQAGVLTGPLYTIYKALTVVQLADQLTVGGTPAVPIFWIASEDHDFHEIAGVNFLNREHQEVEVRLTGHVERQPIGYVQLHREVAQFLDEFAAATPDTDFKVEILTRVRQMAEESADLAEWFGRMMTWLLQETGIIFVDSLDPALRRLGREFFLTVLEKNTEITARLKDAEECLARKGFPAQIQKSEGQVHLFLIEGDARYPLDWSEDGYTLRGREGVYTADELKARVQTSPDTVSTNVVTRPIFQDLLFPTIAYVGGPGEAAYYAEYREIYELFNMEMPIIYPRASITLIERTIAKGLKKYDLEVVDIFERFAEIRARFLAESDELDLPGKFGRLKGTLIPEYQKLVKELQKLDPKFKELGAQNLQRILEEISYLEDKANQQHRKNSEDLLRQLDKLQMNLLPDGILQERRFNILPYLFKYQLGLVHELTQLDLLSANCHHLIYL